MPSAPMKMQPQQLVSPTEKPSGSPLDAGEGEQQGWFYSTVIKHKMVSSNKDVSDKILISDLHKKFLEANVPQEDAEAWIKIEIKNPENMAAAETLTPKPSTTPIAKSATATHAGLFGASISSAKSLFGGLFGTPAPEAPKLSTTPMPVDEAIKSEVVHLPKSCIVSPKSSGSPDGDEDVTAKLIQEYAELDQIKQSSPSPRSPMKGGGLFGLPTNVDAPTNLGGLFGAPINMDPLAGREGLFGGRPGNTPARLSNSDGLLARPDNLPAPVVTGGGLFGVPASSSGGGLFGAPAIGVPRAGTGGIFAASTVIEQRNQLTEPFDPPPGGSLFNSPRIDAAVVGGNVAGTEPAQTLMERLQAMEARRNNAYNQNLEATGLDAPPGGGLFRGPIGQTVTAPGATGGGLFGENPLGGPLLHGVDPIGGDGLHDEFGPVLADDLWMNKPKPECTVFDIKFSAQESDSTKTIWSAIEDGNIQILKAYCPPDFDFSALDPREETKGMTILQVATGKFLSSFLTFADQNKKLVLEVVTWLMQRGADPMQRASPDCKYSSEIKINVPGHIEGAIKVEYAGKTAMTAILNFKEAAWQVQHKIMHAQHFDPEPAIDGLSNAVFNYIIGLGREILEVFAANAANMPHADKSITISEGVLETWERFRQERGAKDVTISAKNADQEVHAHADFLSASSPVLKLMLNGAFSESKDKVISVDDKLAPNTLVLFIDLLYCGSSNMEERDVTTILDVFDLAHRWQVGYVCEICERWLTEMMDIKNVEEITKIALMKNISSLEMACRRYVESNMEAFLDMPAILDDLMKCGRPQPEGQPPRKKRRC